MTARPCPICGRDCGAPLLCREAVPVFLNQVYPAPDAAQQAKSGRLELAYCAACGLGFNSAFDPACAVYTEDYENEQSHSPAFGRHIDRMIERVVQSLDCGRGAILEVGCGQGEFLRRLAAAIASEEVQIIGVDPCYRAGQNPGQRVQFFASALEDLDWRLLPSRFCVALSRHVIEHIHRPVEFLQRLVYCAILSRQGRLLLETPSFEWIVRNSMFMDVFYEHCCYFTRTALIAVTAGAGCRVESIDSAFGGQYYWVAARMAETGEAFAAIEPLSTLRAAEVEAFGALEARVRSYWLAQMQAAARRGVSPSGARAPRE
jgi:SAM-dependent methyltransferase